LNTFYEAPLFSKYSDGLLLEVVPPYDCMNVGGQVLNPPLVMGKQGVSNMLNGDLKSKFAITFLMKKFTGP
jgi:hypothetical protein